MPDDDSTTSTTPTSTGDTGSTGAAPPPPRRRRAASRPAGPPVSDPAPGLPGEADPAAAAAATAATATATDEAEPAAPAKRTRRTTKKAAAPPPADDGQGQPAERAGTPADPPVPDAEPAPPADLPDAAPEPVRARRSRKRAEAPPTFSTPAVAALDEPGAATSAVAPVPPVVLFQQPEATTPAPRVARGRRGRGAAEPVQPLAPTGDEAGAADDPELALAAAALAPDGDGAITGEPLDLDADPLPDALDATTPDGAAPDGAALDEEDEPGEGEDDEQETGARRRRRRGGRGRRSRGRDDEAAEGPAGADDQGLATSTTAEQGVDDLEDPEDTGSEDGEGPSSASRRRRRRRRRGSSGAADDGEPAGSTPDDPELTVVHVREPRKRDRGDRGDRGDRNDEVTAIRGSTRLEAKKQRRRDGRDQGRRRTPVLTESEFLARREAVDRVMVVRQQGDHTQIGVLEDGVLVEHYVTRASSTTFAGNVYLGRVQNVLPSMEAAFVDIGKGRNAVLYAGEVNWDAAGLEGQPRRIEVALKSGDPVLVQVTKDPIGHKGARLTSQVSLPGRYVVYVPDGSMTGISRKLPDTERSRLKAILKQVVPEEAGVIVRTAAEGASEAELSRDVTRLAAQWEDISTAARTASAPALLHGEPDLTVRVVRDVFNEDFARLVVSGDAAWETIEDYVGHVAPDLVPRLERWDGDGDVFAAHRIDEQLTKALDRKVWLPSGGYLVIDDTEAMTVVDVNTGKYVGKGGNLEETVTRNNLEAAEEIVRQLRLRDIGGIIVVDFVDMVLESNRDLVLRRLTECLGRDRTKHQVAEVTSLGLVQMTRKRVGQGLLEAFSETCETCHGRGHIVHLGGTTRAGSGTGGEPARERKPDKVAAAAVAGIAAASRSRGRREPATAEPAPPEATGAEATGAEATGAEATGAEPTGAEPTGAGPTGAEPLTAGLFPTGSTAEPEPTPPGLDAQPGDEPPTRPRRTRRAASRPAGPVGGDEGSGAAGVATLVLPGATPVPAPEPRADPVAGEDPVEPPVRTRPRRTRKAAAPSA